MRCIPNLTILAILLASQHVGLSLTRVARSAPCVASFAGACGCQADSGAGNAPSSDPLAPHLDDLRAVVTRARSAHQDHAKAINGLEDLRDSLRKEAAELATLEREVEAALRELAAGEYCSECGRPASQIVRETGDTFQAHLGKVRGRAIPMKPEQIEAKRIEYDKKIAAQRASVKKLEVDIAEREQRLQAAESAMEESQRSVGRLISSANLAISTVEASAAADAARTRRALESKASQYRSKLDSYEANRASLLAWYERGGPLAERPLEELDRARSELARLKAQRRDVTAMAVDVHQARAAFSAEQEATALRVAGAKDLLDRTVDAYREEERQFPEHLRGVGVAVSSKRAPSGQPSVPVADASPVPLPRTFTGPQQNATPGLLPDMGPLRAAIRDARDRAQAAVGAARSFINEHRSLLNDAASDLLGDFARGREARPIRSVARAYIDSLQGAIRRDLFARLSFGSPPEDLTPEQELEFEASELFRTSVQHPFDVKARLDWVDRWGSLMDKVADRIYGEEGREQGR